ncbi:kelch motif protein (macronuclear) [Tetrahymena thermophila SB210]|uniref:Kelch motif protein n=1 Tax=Tetrahymena thermophila (strain SB210) TaxID=312017 RepID=I7LV83_TETTS|nr:kelch motif protein [Tetrahymena thermophila SB210]EAR97403.2 kelch motif protein [Tetrahymena thermophila SB210]|eukprot:XP_001017648.2 kelch motif protein [Tetrahymena thermophila SB210]
MSTQNPQVQSQDHIQAQNSQNQRNPNEVNKQENNLSRPISQGQNASDKDGIYMRKLQLMQKNQGANELSPNGQNILRVDTANKITTKLQLNNTNTDTKWEELIISGRNIQNRSDFTSVIFDHTMYIYGGYEINAGILSDFHKIDLQAGVYIWDKVVAKNPKKSPGKLCRHSGVVYKNKMYLFGGQYQGQLNHNKMYSFDFATQTWEEVLYLGTIQPPSIDSHKALVYKDTMIVLSGYLGDTGIFSDYIFSFDFNTKVWNVLYDGNSQKNQTYKPRIGAGICLYQEKIYLFGGYDGYERLNDLCYFDLQSKSWNQVKYSSNQVNFLPKTRKGHSLSLYGDYLILFGGIHDVTWELDDLYVFDLRNSRWLVVDEDSARRKDYQNMADISPVKQKQSQRGSFKRNTLYNTQRQKSLLVTSPIKTQNSNFSPNNAGSATRKSLNRGTTQIYQDPYYAMSESADQPHSPTRNLDNQKKKEFFQKKAEMLAQLQTGEDEEKMMRNNSNSPTSEAMKNALITIGNPMPELKQGKKGKTTDFGRITFSKFLEPIKCPANSKVGKKPCARDGHAAAILQRKLYIFGGDRHKMSFNDMFALDLEKCLNQLQQQQQ